MGEQAGGGWAGKVVGEGGARRTSLCKSKLDQSLDVVAGEGAPMANLPCCAEPSQQSSGSAGQGQLAAVTCSHTVAAAPAAQACEPLSSSMQRLCPAAIRLHSPARRMPARLPCRAEIVAVLEAQGLQGSRYRYAREVQEYAEVRRASTEHLKLLPVSLPARGALRFVCQQVAPCLTPGASKAT